MKGRFAALGLSAFLLVDAFCVAKVRAQTAYSFDVPAEALDKALTAVGGTAHVNIVFPPAAVSGKSSSAIKGTYTVTSALQAILSETGLDLVQTKSGAYFVTVPNTPDVLGTVPDAAQTLAEQVKDPSGPSPTIPTVIIRGYRASLVESLSAKRAFSGEVESIFVEDIAKFPDNNVAEAIQRVAGVAISRDQGEGRSITVRGLGPEFTRVEINRLGTQASTDGPTQGINKGRGFDFNVFPSELFSRIDVRKTSGADQSEGSLGSTVILFTPHPFDRPGLRLAAAAQATYNDLSDRRGQRDTFLFSNTFDQKRFGVLFMLAYSQTPLDIQGVNSGGWNQGTANGGFCKPTAGTGGICDVPASDLSASLDAYNLAEQPTTYHPQFYRYTELTGVATRLGANLSLQWRPQAGTTFTFDALDARFATRRSDHFLEAIGFSRGASQGGKPETIPRQVVLDGNNTMLYGLFDNVDVRSELSIDNFTTDFQQVSLLLKQKFSDKLALETTVGHSQSAFNNFDQLTVQIDRQNVDGYSFDTRSTGRDRPSLIYGFDVTDPANWYFGPRVLAPGGTGSSGPEIRLRPNFVYNDVDTFQAKLTYDPDPHMRVTAGIEAKRYSHRTVGYRFDQGEADFPVPTVPLSQLTHVFCGLGAVAPPGTPRCWLEPDVDAFTKAYDLFSDTGRTALSTTNAAARGLNQAVTESDGAAFAKVWFTQTLFGRPFHGDFGVRDVGTHQDAVFYTNVPASVNPNGYMLTSVSRHYNDFLPSLNIVYDNTRQSLWRFSVAKVMARPPLEYLAAATTVTVLGGQRFVTTGNANLEPYRATTLDLSYEWYPKDGGLASVGLFYKDISTYVQNVTHIAPYSTTNLPVSLLANTGAAATDDFSISNVVNTPGGPLRGIELNYQRPFKFLPGFWSRFGVLFNYTYVVSRITYETTSPTGTTTVKADLLNLSRNSYNATAYYDDGTFEARLSTNYRDKYITAVPGAFNADASGVNAGTYWDGSVSYRIRPNLTLTFEGLNLTNEKSQNWDNTVTQLVGDMRISGRQFTTGLRYTF